MTGSCSCERFSYHARTGNAGVVDLHVVGVGSAVHQERVTDVRGACDSETRCTSNYAPKES